MTADQIDWLAVYADGDHAAKFKAFHDANPWVADRLIAMTRTLMLKGHKRVGIGMLFEVLRWNHLQSTVGDPFKLNNNYRAYYVRLIEQRCPDMVGLFEKRRSAADTKQGEKQ